MATELSSPNARETCEAMLRAERSDRIKKAILPSEVEVIDRLLGRGLELGEAYDELRSKLDDHPPALQVFFGLLLRTAAFWNPEANLEAREGRARLIEVTRQIGEKATELASLLNERTDLQDHSGFSCDTHYHPVHVIHAAAEKNYRYQHWVKEKLKSITEPHRLSWRPVGLSQTDAVCS